MAKVKKETELIKKITKYLEPKGFILINNYYTWKRETKTGYEEVQLEFRNQGPLGYAYNLNIALRCSKINEALADFFEHFADTERQTFHEKSHTLAEYLGNEEFLYKNALRYFDINTVEGQDIFFKFFVLFCEELAFPFFAKHQTLADFDRYFNLKEDGSLKELDLRDYSEVKFVAAKLAKNPRYEDIMTMWIEAYEKVIPDHVKELKALKEYIDEL